MPFAPTYLLKRHPVAIEAIFDFVLVLTYAFPKNVLEPLLAPGLTLDTFGDLGFLAVALVNTRHMRPKGMPEAIGQDFLLIGYRIFARYKTIEGRTLRGLRILRSEADRPLMVQVGNVMTHYNYHLTKVTMEREGHQLKIWSQSADKLSDLRLTAQLFDDGSEHMPEGSPFSSVREALKFAGPMPFTFDYERETHSIIRVEGVRQNWHPQSIPVVVDRCTFFNSEPFAKSPPILCSGFYMHDVPYWWKPGIVEKVQE